jgi:hypothetical protein
MKPNERLNRLEHAAATPRRTVFFWRDGDALTPAQKAAVARAEGRGDDVMVFGWEAPRDGN